MKKILIIGGDSFIAGQFIRKYVSTDSITCYSRRPTGYEKEIVVKAFRDMPVEAFSGFDAVINFAAIVHRPEVKDQELCLLYTSPSPRDGLLSRMPSSA